MKLLTIFTGLCATLTIAAPASPSDTVSIPPGDPPRALSVDTLNSILTLLGEPTPKDGNPSESSADIARCDNCRMEVGMCVLAGHLGKWCNRYMCDHYHDMCHLCKNLPC